MGYLDKAGLSRAFTKLKTLIDKKQDKMKQISLPSSATTYKNKWIKFATIDLSSSNAWYVCSGTLSFTQGEGGNALGTLKFYCRNGNKAGVIGSSSLIWVSLSDNSYADSVVYVKVANGKYDMYYKPLKDYETPWIALVDCTAYNLFTFSTNSYVDSITASNTSIVASHASSASSVPWSGVSGKPSTFTPSSHTHDDRYYTESEVDSKLNGKANSSHTHTKSQITDFPTSMPASDVYAWAKASSKPSYSKSEIGLSNVDNTADSTKSVKYAASAGSASKCNNVIYTHQNEINFSGGKQPTCYFNYRNADSDASDGGTTAITYKFCNYTSNTAYSTIEANNFVGKINGNTVSKSVPSNANFSNDKVAQTAVKNTDYSDWRSLVWGASHSSTEGFTPTSVTDNLFSTNTLSVQPSTGTIKATTFKGNLTGKATSASRADRAIEVADYNNTNQGIKIGYAGDGFTASDFQYALGMNSARKIKDVSQAEYRKWLGLGSAAYTSSDAYASASHTHNYAGSSSAGGSANWAKGADYANYAFSENGVSASGNGSVYTAAVNGFSLGTGKSIVIIPDVTSNTTTPTLNVSNTGPKNIRMRLSSSTSSTIPLINSSFLTKGKPVKVTYDGNYWVIDDFIQPDANHLYGTLISRGSSAPSSGTAGFIYIQTT